MQYELPKLNYDYKDLEPSIDAQTMEIHHTKHHQGYINKLNTTLQEHPELAEKSLEELIRTVDELDDTAKASIRNNGGGHFNHSLFWDVMTPGGSKINDEMEAALIESFGSFVIFQEEFEKAALSRFGSGWAWLLLNGSRLEIASTPNQANPLMEGKTPILGLDVWEHAYYLKYQNKRAEYIKSWWAVVDWKKVLELYEKAI